MKRLFAFVMLLAAMQARASNPWGTDLSDMWWNPDESGWGANIAHQNEVVFLTLYVYGADGHARWYVAPDLAASGGLVFSGSLYETTGPYLGGPFNPAAVNARAVGTAAVTLTSASTATLAYSVDGVGVTKSIQRQSFRTADMTGTYTGALVGTVEGCGATTTFAASAGLSISQASSAFTMTEVNQGNGNRCTYSGTYSQAGKMGAMNGTFTCTNGTTGSMQMFEMEAGYIGFLARYTATYGNCRESGKIGGMKQ